MAPMRGRAVALSGLVLLTSLAACGSPSNASKDDFCKVATASNDNTEIYEGITAEDWEKVEGIYHDQADALDEVGTPEGVSDDVRDGFEARVDALNDISADEIEQAVADGKDVVVENTDKDDRTSSEAFDKYVITTCVKIAG